VAETSGEPAFDDRTVRREPRLADVLPFSRSRPGQEPTNADEPRLRDVIGEVLRDERLRQERTLADVAEEAAVSLPYLSEVERGRKEVSSDLLWAIGDALELPLVEILERSADRLRSDGFGGRDVQMLAA
jgi:XRE family transcriptional regulator, stress-response regulator